MKTRPLGSTGHDSSILTFGTIALNWLEQEGANQAIELVMDRGVNHFDVAPTYGDAEEKLAPKLAEYREDIFLGCKTQKRTYEAAWEELETSLDRLGVERFNLYQFHAVTEGEELDTIVGEDGALDAFREAKKEGLIDHVGLTSHGGADLIVEAIDLIDDLATVMFPLNYVVLGGEGQSDYGRVLDRARTADLGTIGIKAFAKRPWPSDLPEGRRDFSTWYEPFDRTDEIRECLNFALTQGLTSITNVGDPKLLLPILDAADAFEPLTEAEQNALRERGRELSSPVPME